jgi:hypothetical protein
MFKPIADVMIRRALRCPRLLTKGEARPADTEVGRAASRARHPFGLARLKTHRALTSAYPIAAAFRSPQVTYEAAASAIAPGTPEAVLLSAEPKLHGASSLDLLPTTKPIGIEPDYEYP